MEKGLTVTLTAYALNTTLGNSCYNIQQMCMAGKDFPADVQTPSCPHVSCGFPATLEMLQPDAIPAAANDSHGGISKK